MLFYERGQERLVREHREMTAGVFRASFDAGVRVALVSGTAKLKRGATLPEPSYVLGDEKPNRDGVTREQMERQFAELKALYPNAVHDYRNRGES